MKKKKVKVNEEQARREELATKIKEGVGEPAGIELIIGLLTIEIETLIKQLIKSKLLDEKKFANEVSSRMEDFIKSGILDHSIKSKLDNPDLLAPALPKEKVRYIG